MEETISKNAVLKLLDEMLEIAKINFEGDEVLVDMICTIRDKIQIM